MSTPFACPICLKPLSREGNSLRCPARHTFDVAREGYVNLLLKKPGGLYEDKALFEARRAAYRAGFFTPLAEAILPFVRPGTVVDAGCGEGSLLFALSAGGACRGIGVDIARPAVRLAARSYPGLFWCVGDVCGLPLPDGAADTLVNVLTPANYEEFARVVKPLGRLVKAVPGPEHLKEIRALTGKAPGGQSAEETLPLLQKRFALKARRDVRYTVACDAALAGQVYAMTPLTAHEARRALPAMRVTADFTLLVGEREP